MVEEGPGHPAGVEGAFGSRCPPYVERMRLRRDGEDRCRVGRDTHTPRPIAGIEGRGHDDEAEVVTELEEFPAHGEDEVGVEVAFVDLVEDDRGDAAQLGVGEHPPQQHSRGDELDPGACRDRGLPAHREADVLAEAGPRQVREPPRRSAGRHPSRLGDDDAAGVGSGGGAQMLGDERGHEGRLAGAGRGFDDEAREGVGHLDGKTIDELSRREVGADRPEVEGVHAPSLSGCSARPREG